MRERQATRSFGALRTAMFRSFAALPFRLTSMTGLFVAALVVSTALAGPAWAQGAKVYGVDIVPWSKKIGEGRYRSGRTFDKTVKFFRDNFRGSKRVKWHAEVNVPRVKYKHLQNLSKTRKWDGINIYEIKNTVYIYVLKHEDDDDKSTGAKKGEKKGATLLSDPAALEAFFAQAPAADLDQLAVLLSVD